MKTKERFIHSIGPVRQEACELPTQEDLGIEQERANAKQEKEQSGVARSGRRTTRKDRREIRADKINRNPVLQLIGFWIDTHDSKPMFVKHSY